MTASELIKILQIMPPDAVVQLEPHEDITVYYVGGYDNAVVIKARKDLYERLR